MNEEELQLLDPCVPWFPNGCGTADDAMFPTFAKIAFQKLEDSNLRKGLAITSQLQLLKHVPSKFATPHDLKPSSADSTPARIAIRISPVVED